jgi:hypothetical protein
MPYVEESLLSLQTLCSLSGSCYSQLSGAAGVEAGEFTFGSLIAGSDAVYTRVVNANADAVRNFFDSLFPDLAKNPYADVSRGYWHRWEAGHGITDVLRTASDKGIKEGLKHFGHIFFTDFPTAKGIPLPGFAENELGGILAEKFNVPKQWLNINLFDSVLAVYSVAEGGSDLIAALAGTLQMSAPVFLDTFGEGAFWIVLASLWTNSPYTMPLKPFLYLAGAENILAGAVSAFKTLSSYVSPEAFMGSFFLSAFLGGAIVCLLNHKQPAPETAKLALATASKSGLIGAAGAVSAFFGGGVFLGLTAFTLGKALAMYDQKHEAVTSPETFQMIVDEVNAAYPGFSDLLNRHIDIKNTELVLDYAFAIDNPMPDIPNDTAVKIPERSINIKTPSLSLDRAVVIDNPVPDIPDNTAIKI